MKVGEFLEGFEYNSYSDGERIFERYSGDEYYNQCNKRRVKIDMNYWIWDCQKKCFCDDEDENPSDAEVLAWSVQVNAFEDEDGFDIIEAVPHIMTK